MEDLTSKQCVPCSGGTPKLEGERIEELLPQLGGWDVVEEQHLSKEYKFPDFAEALRFVNRVGAVAEAEGHHPDIFFGWGYAHVKIWTHAVDGLTESDFILAAKIDKEVLSAEE